jgi:hypothetical protein
MVKKLKQKTLDVYKVVAELTWRGFGIFLFIMGGSAGLGAALTGSWLNGIVIAWGALMLSVVATIGYAIATTGRATRDDVARGARDAIEKAKSDSSKK